MKKIVNLKFLQLFAILFLFSGLGLYAQYAIDFDGANDYINIGNDASLSVGNTVTVEAWIFPRDLSGRKTIFSTRSQNTAGSWQVEAGTGNNHTNVLAVTGVNTWVAESADNALTLNTWNHIAFVRDGGTGAGSVTLYVNGEMVALQTESAYDFVDNTSAKTIGAGTNIGSFFNGAIDELKVWNIALTSEQINPDRNSSLDGSEAGLIAYYKMDEGTGSTISDASVNNNDGTLMGSPIWVNNQRLYVDADALGNNDGTSWVNAYNSLQSALDASVGGNEIWVAASTYYPTKETGGSGTRYRAFQMKNYVAIYGGFAGNENSVDERNLSTNETILSGDIGTPGDNGDNCYHIFYHPSSLNITNTAIIDGFTITGSNANGGYPHYYGGGFFNNNSSPSINNCIIKENAATYGGGITNFSSSNPNITNCNFLSNTSLYHGGAMYNSHSEAIISGSVFTENFSGWAGGAMYNSSSSLTIKNCEFTLNTAGTGGGAIYIKDTESINTLINCVISHNYAANNGGGISVSSSSANLTNCTVSYNVTDDDFGGGINNHASSVALNNCIIWYNRAPTNGFQIKLYEGDITMNYCCYSNESFDIENLRGKLTLTNNNINTEPMFVSGLDYDFRINGSSPCVNAGNNTYNSETIDIRGQARKQGTIDIGAYEWTEGIDPFYEITIWVGSVSNDWNNSENWQGLVPNNKNDVIIPEGRPFYPTLTSDVECYNLTIKSSSTGTGSLIGQEYLTVSNTVLVERYLAADRWYLVSPPVQEQNISNFLTNANNSIAYKSDDDYYGVTTYIEADDNWEDYFTLSTTGNFESGKGYLMRRQNENGVVTFNGTPATGEVTVPVTNSATDYGWNSVGNPYTSAIGVTSGATSTQNFLTENAGILDDNYEALYIWDESLGSENADYVIVSNAGFTNNTGKDPWDTDYLQLGQGFIVKANANGNVTFTPEMQTHLYAQPLKSAEESWPGIIVSASANGFTSSAGITFYEGMTEGLDPGYDAGAFKSNSELSVFTRLINDNGHDFGLQCLPESALDGTTIPVGIETTTAGEINIGIEKIGLPHNLQVWFEDRLNGTTREITSPEESVTVTVVPNEEAYGRFYLSIGESTDISKLKENRFNAWHSDGKIIISGKIKIGSDAELFDMQGRKLMTVKLNDARRNHLEVGNIKDGIYLLRIFDGMEQQTLKVPVTRRNQ